MIIRIIKRVVFAFITIYSLDLLLKGFNIIIPINIYTVLITTLLGFPGIIMLVLSFFLLL